MAKPRLTAPLLLGALGALAIIIASGVAGWLVIDDLEARNQSSGDAEILTDIAAVDKLSGIVASAASVPTNSRMTSESIAELRAAIASNEAQLAERLSALEGRGYDSRVERIGQQVDLLTANVSRIEDERPALLEAILAGERSWQQLLFSTNQKLLPAISSQSGQSVLLRDDGQERIQGCRAGGLRYADRRGVSSLLAPGHVVGVDIQRASEPAGGEPQQPGRPNAIGQQ